MLLIADIFFLWKSESSKAKEEPGFSCLVLLERDLGLGCVRDREGDGLYQERRRSGGGRGLSYKYVCLVGGLTRRTPFISRE